MEKIWYIFVDGKEEGPYSFLDLKRDPRVTPDILIRRKDWPKGKWLPLRKIKELKDLFKDEEDKEDEEAKKNGAKLSGNDILALDMRYDPSYYIWILIFVIAIIYVIFRLHHSL